MRIGITGATGFLGKHFALSLITAGHDVLGLGRDTAKGRGLEEAGVPFRSVDLRDGEAIASALSGVDMVFHMAALSAVWGAYSEFHESNVVGTENVIEACRFHGIRKLVYVSSSSVYFDFTDRLGICEKTDVARPCPSLYTRSKLEAEERVRASGDLDWIILRPRGIFGPGDSSIIPRVLRIARKGWFPLVRGGEVLVDLTYVGNLVQVLALCVAAKERAWNQVYNVSNGEPVSIVDFFDQVMRGLDISPRKVNTPVFVMKRLAAIVETLAKALGLDEPPLTRYTAGLLCHHQTLDISKSRQLLGYVPEISIREGVRRTVSFMKEAGE